MDVARYDVRPATAARFDDVRTMLAPKQPGAGACWCLSYRLPGKVHTALSPAEREETARGLARRRPATGVLAYDGDEVVGWAGVAPREDVAAFRDHDRYPYVEGAWLVWCLKTRAGRRGRGVGTALLEGAVAHAASNGARVVEGFPVDNEGARVDTTMAFVGLRSLFDRCGFSYAGPTGATSAGLPRVAMRRDVG